MREKPSLLEDVADPAAVLRHEDAAFGIGEHVAVDFDATPVGAGKPGDDPDKRGLARTGWAEEGGEPAVAPELDLQTKVAEAMVDVDLDRHLMDEPARGPLGQILGCDDRRHRDGDRDEGQAHGLVVAARHLDERVDRGRQRLGLAGDVRDESDRRAEFAHRLGESEDHAGDDAGGDQRQRHRHEHQDRVGTEGAGGRFEAPVDPLDGQPDRAHQQRKAHDPASERGPRPAEGEHDPELLGEERADHTAPSEQDQENVAGDHRREHERHVDDAVQERPAPEPAAGKDHGDENAERQAHDRRPQRNLEAQPDGRKLLRAEPQPIHVRGEDDESLFLEEWLCRGRLHVVEERRRIGV